MNFLLFIIEKLKKKLMLKNFKPIVIVAGEPKSVFLEIYLKAIKKKYFSPLILICNKNELQQQMKIVGIKKKLNS